MRQFTDTETYTVVNGLRVAADLFKQNAEELDGGNYARLKEQFLRQEKESRELADRIEMHGGNLALVSGAE
jgi:hypothetical protein